MPLFGGQSIGFPPILKFANDALIEKIAPDILLGKKRICLAVSEPYAGSDVAQIKTKAVFDEASQEWIVSGVKKWITGGMFSEYFTTLVQTSKGHAMMLVERDDMHLSTRALKTSYSMAAGTAWP